MLLLVLPCIEFEGLVSVPSSKGLGVSFFQKTHSFQQSACSCQFSVMSSSRFRMFFGILPKPHLTALGRPPGIFSLFLNGFKREPYIRIFFKGFQGPTQCLGDEIHAESERV